MRFFSLALLASAIAWGGAAQAQLVQGFGLKAGMNSSRIAAETNDDFMSYRGFQVGGYVELGAPLVPVSALVEVEYARRGYEYAQIQTNGGGMEGEEVTASTALHFVSVPVLARVELPGALVVTPYAIAGPRLDLLVAYDAGRFDFEGFPDLPVFEDPFPELFSTASLSGVVGGGVSLGALIGPEVRLEARYGFGLTDLGDDGVIGLRNRGIDVSVALGF